MLRHRHPYAPLDHEAKQRPAHGWPLALCAWSLLYMLAHLYWALGGDALLFMGRSGRRSEMDDWRAINWAASVVLTGATLVGPALIWTTARPRLRAATLVTCIGGAAIAGAHGSVRDHLPRPQRRRRDRHRGHRVGPRRDTSGCWGCSASSALVPHRRRALRHGRSGRSLDHAGSATVDGRMPCRRRAWRP